MKKDKEKQVTLSSYAQKHVLETDAGKVIFYLGITIVVLYGSKYLFNGLAASISAFKNLKRSIKET